MDRHKSKLNDFGWLFLDYYTQTKMNEFGKGWRHKNRNEKEIVWVCVGGWGVGGGDKATQYKLHYVHHGEGDMGINEIGGSDTTGT